MKKSFLLIIATSLILSGCGKNAKTSNIETIKTVKTAIVQSGATLVKRDFPGIVESSSKTNLSFDISGRLIKLPIKNGQKVQAGRIIAQLEPDTQNYKLNSAKASYLEAQTDFNRNKELYAEGIISASQYQARKRKFETAKASLNLAQKTLNYTILKAPFTGTITKKIAENYQYINGKETIAVLQDLNDLEVKINVPESLMSYENEVNNMTFNAVFEAYPNIEFPLTLKSKGQQADDITKTYPIKFYIKDKNKAVILPGMTSTVFIKGSLTKQNYINVPVKSVFMDENDNKCVWIVKNNNTITKSPIQIKEIKNNKAIVLSGLKNDDRVVIAGVYHILEGDKIKEYERLDLAK